MRVFFIKPGSADTNFPHSYAVLSAYIKQCGHTTQFYDAALQGESPETVMAKLSFDGVDLVAMSVLVGWHTWVAEFIRQLKKNYPSVQTAVGGPHISSLQELAMEHIHADYGIVGEGEKPFARLLECLQKGKPITDIPGLIYQKNNEYIKTPFPLERVRRLDELPMPDYDLVRPDKYFHTYVGASVGRRKQRLVQTVTSRGCPFECTFCATNCTWERKMTFYSPERVIQELKLLKSQYGVEEVWFGDDGFTTDRRRTEEICRRMLNEKLNLAWRLPNGIRIDSLDDSLVGVMKEAGCYMVGVGVETGSQSMMKKIKKRLDLDIIPEKIKILKKHKLLASAFFILGYDDETPEELEETVNFIAISPFERMQICTYWPVPGSESFNRVFRQDDPEKFRENVKRFLNEGRFPDFLQYLDRKTIAESLRQSYLRFYTRPDVIWSVVRHMTLRQFLDIFKNPSVRLIFKKSS